jgi:glyoxylase-like metal-dependent hydrolase (beta-lactamase superfamily II)
MFKQFFDEPSSTYTYLIADDATGEAALIDPVREQVDGYLRLLRERGLELLWVLDTHVHADHITAANALKSHTGARTAVGAACGASGVDKPLCDGDAIIVGNEVIRAIATPGHTPGSMSYLWRDRVFTGDALLIGGCGRTDFQRGDAEALYYSITGKLFALDDDTLVFPGHDYKGRRVSSIAEEKALNPRLAGKSREDFVTLMRNLDLPLPKRINEALPANLVGGTV